MGILVNTGFDVGSSNPIDSRTLKNTIDERDALVNAGLVYENLKVYCKDTQTEYRWTGTDWEEVGSGGTVDLSGYAKTYTSLAELGLTADATIDDVLSKLQSGETFISGISDFTNYQTLFPYKSANDKFSRVFIQQGSSQATAYIKWFRKDSSREALANIDSNNKVVGWNEHTMNKNTYTSIADLNSAKGTSIELVVNTDNTLKIVEALDEGEEFVDWFGNSNDRFGLGANAGSRINYLRIAKTNATNAIILAVTDYGKTFSRVYNGGNLENWCYDKTKATLVTNTTTLKLDVTKKYSAWYGAIKLTYLYDTSPAEIEISFRAATEDLRWAVINGQKYVKNITFTQDSSNTAHYTIGIEFSGTTYGCYQAEVIGDFADINSLTKEAFTGEKTAVYYSPWGKNNGVTLVSSPEDIGLTHPCTTVQLAQAMRNKFNKTISAGAIGVFNCGGKATTITDAPAEYGLLHIETFGHDRMLIRFDGISGSSYAGSWIGRIKGSNGTFSGITWSKIIIEDSSTDPYSCTGYTSLTGTEDLFTLPCGHYVSATANTTYNYPITDSSNVTAHIYILGHLNEPANNKGYRMILYFDNKGRTYNANEWWGGFNPWNRIDNDTRVTTLETQVDELFQSVSNGKTSVANAITGKGVSTATDATFATMATNIGKITNYTASEKTALATAITNKGVSTSSTASFSAMATNVGKITNYTTSEKTALATAITNKGVSTSSTASFSTMATNIGKISSCKEETKSYNNTSDGIIPIVITFSANVLGIKQIVAPSDSFHLVPQYTADMFRIEDKTVTMYVNGRGTWKVTAIIQA